jgi:hypothetical protein
MQSILRVVVNSEHDPEEGFNWTQQARDLLLKLQATQLPVKAITTSVVDWSDPKWAPLIAFLKERHVNVIIGPPQMLKHYHVLDEVNVAWVAASPKVELWVPEYVSFVNENFDLVLAVSQEEAKPLQERGLHIRAVVSPQDATPEQLAGLFRVLLAQSDADVHEKASWE